MIVHSWKPYFCAVLHFFGLLNTNYYDENFYVQIKICTSDACVDFGYKSGHLGTVQ
jgi:hypothetical protein